MRQADSPETRRPAALAPQAREGRRSPSYYAAAPCIEGCGARVTRSSKSGRCGACAGRLNMARLRADPEIAAKIEAARRDPEIAAKRGAAVSATRRRRSWKRLLSPAEAREYRMLHRDYGVRKAEALRAIGRDDLIGGAP